MTDDQLGLEANSKATCSLFSISVLNRKQNRIDDYRRSEQKCHPDNLNDFCSDVNTVVQDALSHRLVYFIEITSFFDHETCVRLQNRFGYTLNQVRTTILDFTDFTGFATRNGFKGDFLLYDFIYEHGTILRTFFQTNTNSHSVGTPELGPDERQLNFGLKAAASRVIILSESSSLSGAYYEIEIGAENNMKSIIKYGGSILVETKIWEIMIRQEKVLLDDKFDLLKVLICIGALGTRAIFVRDCRDCSYLKHAYHETDLVNSDTERSLVNTVVDVTIRVFDKEVLEADGDPLFEYSRNDLDETSFNYMGFSGAFITHFHFHVFLPFVYIYYSIQKVGKKLHFGVTASRDACIAIAGETPDDTRLFEIVIAPEGENMSEVRTCRG
ncbi:uncharacterized protein [Apostichopus japonicus]|uniref:uncharacterized protein n=1 Tax=Stichopus japonicus TaxID=307972 RepID=UPI003AB7D8B2